MSITDAGGGNSNRSSDVDMARSNDQVSSESSEQITFVRGSLLHSCPTDSMHKQLV